ncbi:MAG: CYTH domain-containing protein [Rubrivivax sp.]|nr:CYTH domain-containing protein [Rubrivivax sp.]
MRKPDAGTEIELKFQVPAERLPALVRALGTATARSVVLRARYFDTPDGRLQAARLAWRLRHEDGRWVQTLKGPGDGLLQRLEHALPRDPADGDPPLPDPSLHAGHPAGAALVRALKGGRAVLRHGTEITRLRRVLRHRGARIELALDRGEVVAGAARAALTELEFELLAGPMPALLDLAGRWARRFGLRLDPASKSERAAWLLQGLAMRPVARGGRPPPTIGMAPAASRATRLSAALAHVLSNAAAITEGRHGPGHLHELCRGLRRLRGVLRACAPADPPREAALARLLAALGVAPEADAQAVAQVLCAPDTTALWLQLLALTLRDADAAPAGAVLRPAARPRRRKPR